MLAGQKEINKRKKEIRNPGPRSFSFFGLTFPHPPRLPEIYMPAIYNWGLNLMPLLETYGKEKHSSSEGWVGEAQSRLNMSKGQCVHLKTPSRTSLLCVLSSLLFSLRPKNA